MKGAVNYLLDMDIRVYYEHIDRCWLMKMLKERIVDRTILRLIGKWLKLGVLEEGKRTFNEVGVPPGSFLRYYQISICIHIGFID